MKKVIILLGLVSLIFTSCEFDSSEVVVDEISLDHTSFTETGFEYRNNEFVFVRNKINVYTINVYVMNTGDMTAYDVEVDVTIEASNGEQFTESHYIGRIDPYETVYIAQDETFENARINEYYADVYWAD